MSRLDKSSTHKKILIITFLFIFLILSSLLSICYGSTKINFSDIMNCLVQNNTESNTYKIIYFVRLPRTIASLLAGCALSVSGVILQATLNNSLASPNIIGVNSGAGLFTILIITLFPNRIELIPIGAFIGAIIASLLVCIVAYRIGQSRMTIILSGVAISSVFSAGIDAITTIFPNDTISINSFMIGSFSAATFKNINTVIIYIIIGVLLSIILSYDLNILMLGDETARSLGMNVRMYRFVFLIIASVLAGCAVSICGLLGFVGLIVPHLTRKIIGNDNRLLVPTSAILGATFVCICDLVSRVLFAPYEIPVGIIMSFLGGPFFMFLLFKNRGSVTND